MRLLASKPKKGASAISKNKSGGLLTVGVLFYFLENGVVVLIFFKFNSLVGGEQFKELLGGDVGQLEAGFLPSVVFEWVVFLFEPGFLRVDFEEDRILFFVPLVRVLLMSELQLFQVDFEFLRFRE